MHSTLNSLDAVSTQQLTIGQGLADPVVRLPSRLAKRQSRLIAQLACATFDARSAFERRKMAHLVLTAPPVPTIPVAGEGEFPVRRVYCIGRNYAAHAIEMGHDPDREQPFFFQKNPDNLTASGEFPYPAQSTDVHHEVELAVALRSGGTTISVSQALSHVWGYAIALDMTRRDLQAEAKTQGRPWEIGKAFEHSAPIGPLMPVAKAGHLACGRIELTVNDKVVQTGDLNQMIWKVPEIIAVLSDYFELRAGDVILTGTPAGVGPVQRGDRMTATIEGLGSLDVTVV